MTSVTYFQKELLPPPSSFYEQELGRLTRPNRKGWAQTRCPFHESRSGKSLAVNLDSGGFYCFGCEARGGDVVSFVRLRCGLSFKEACQQLGVWREDNKCASKLPPHILAPWLVLDAVIDGVQYRVSLRDEPRNYADKIRRFYREASDRLIELSHGDSETYAGEQQSCWDRMACALDELRELESV
jgi:hypothetical protein